MQVAGEFEVIDLESDSDDDGPESKEVATAREQKKEEENLYKLLVENVPLYQQIVAEIRADGTWKAIEDEVNKPLKVEQLKCEEMKRKVQESELQVKKLEQKLDEM